MQVCQPTASRNAKSSSLTISSDTVKPLCQDSLLAEYCSRFHPREQDRSNWGGRRDSRKQRQICVHCVPRGWRKIRRTLCRNGECGQDASWCFRKLPILWHYIIRRSLAPQRNALDTRVWADGCRPLRGSGGDLWQAGNSEFSRLFTECSGHISWRLHSFGEQ